MKLQALTKNWKEGEDHMAKIDGENGISVHFVRDRLKRIFVRVFLSHKPEHSVHVAVSRFFQGTVVEEFSPESFYCVGSIYVAERRGFPKQIFAEMLGGDTVRAGVEEAH